MSPLEGIDGPTAYERLDPSDFLGAVENFHEQFRQALTLGDEADLPEPGDIASVAILGVGGSGISGDVLEVALKDSPAFVRTIRGATIPGWIGPQTVAFAVSYSGNTEETVGATEAALAAGAQVVTVTTGGRLGEIAKQRSLPMVTLPSGLRPRAGLGYLTIPMIVMCERLGLVKVRAELDEAADLLDQRAGEYSRDADANSAKILARGIGDSLPVVYGSPGAAAVAAYRWKCQFNECTKIPSFWGYFSELTHNEVEGWEGMDHLTRSSLALLVLRHDGETPEMTARIDETLSLIQDHFALVQEVRASGESDLARMFDLISLGDFTATYLALMKGVDPAKMDAIEGLKERLSR